MKIKCPACATVLSVPDAAAGKVVKCPCGKQLRAPGGAAAPTASGVRPATGPSAPSSVAGGRATAGGRPTAAASRSSDFDPGMFDELTESDLQPVRAVASPGRSTANPGAGSAGSKLLQQYGSTSDRAGALLLGPSMNRPIAGVGKRIGGAMIDGFFSLIGMGLGFGLMIAVLSIRGGEGENAGGVSDPSFWAFMVGALIPPIINAVLVSMSGQTVGKKMVGTVIVNETTGAPVGFTQGILQRNVVFGIFTGLPFVGVFVALADIVYLFLEDHQTLHDKYAKTMVVEAR